MIFRPCRPSLVTRALLALFLLAPGGAAWAQAYFERYGLSTASPALDLGVQPLGYPSGVISAVMQRDRILRAALAASEHPLRAHPFQRGADMLGLLAEQRLEAGLLGDVPTLLAAAHGDVWIVGLVKQTSTSIVARGEIQVRNLAGKRIGYVETSSAHHTLLQGLSSAGLGENDVELVPMRVDDMPAALARGAIDAFAAWEPAPSIALRQSTKHRIVFRGLSADYFVIGRAFEKSAPEAARLLVAGFARALEWMRRGQKNVETAARWAVLDAEQFSGKPSSIAVNQIVAIVRREILNVPSAPIIVSPPGAPPVLRGEFDFLKRLGKIPDGGQWTPVSSALAYDGLARVMAEPRKYRVNDFDYAD